MSAEQYSLSEIEWWLGDFVADFVNVDRLRALVDAVRAAKRVRANDRNPATWNEGDADLAALDAALARFRD